MNKTLKDSIKKNKWMLSYSLVFIYLSYSFIENDINNDYELTYIIWNGAIYVFFNTGNFIFIFSKESHSAKRIWKLLFPLALVGVVASIIIDSKYGSTASDNESLLQTIIAFSIAIALLTPSVMVNYKLAYGKNE
jgi:hypothetical protein